MGVGAQGSRQNARSVSDGRSPALGTSSCHVEVVTAQSNTWSNVSITPQSGQTVRRKTPSAPKDLNRVARRMLPKVASARRLFRRELRTCLLLALSGPKRVLIMRAIDP